MTEQAAQERYDPATHRAVIVYTDDDGKEHEFDGDPNSLTFQQVWDMQKVTGLNGLEAIGQAMSETNAPALMAFLWAHLREEQPGLKFHDLGSVRLSQIELRAVPKESADPKGSAPTGSHGSTSDAATTSTASSPSSDSTSESDPPISPI